MINTRFELYKFRRENKRVGIDLIVYRNKLNEYGESSEGILEVVKSIKGIYHETSNYIKQNTSEGSITRVKKSPMLLVELEHCQDIQINDMVNFNGKQYHITGITNIQGWNILGDISLEFRDGNESIQ